MYKTILYIEDEQQIAEIYAELLRPHGYEIDLAYDGRTGLEQARSKQYDLILLDLMLPQLSGAEILDILRDKSQSPTFSDTTDIIILTNFDVDDVTKQNMLTKAQGYLIKVDATPKKLMEYLNELSARKQAN
jgi:two-component system, OmpR family, response regulator ArlR